MDESSESRFDDIVAELYAVPPGTFTAARNARASELTGAAAKEVRALRKPGVAAWVVNAFVREHPDALRQALDLGAQLREAQSDLDAATLAELGRQRRALVRALAAQAAEVGTTHGERMTPATLGAVEQTLNAAMLHADAARAVASGRLLRPLVPGDEAGVEDAVAGSLAPAQAPAEAPADEVAARRARKQAERALHEAEQAVAAATRDVARRRREADGAMERATRLVDRVRELRGQLQAVEEQARHASEEHDATHVALADADAALTAAVADEESARAALEAL